MPKRRPLTGRPLLIATAAVLSTGCKDKLISQPTVGNPVPPAATLCVTTLPEGARLAFNGEPAEDGCLTPEGSTSSVLVEVSLADHLPHREVVQMSGEDQAITITLTPDIEPPPPVGNLIPPPLPIPQPAPGGEDDAQ